ncbi:MAG: F0F1 ATP synthase subunit epsilon [Steroidobacteraceae bacterium]
MAESLETPEHREGLHVDIVSAEGAIFSGPARTVFVPASQGELGILAQHAPLLTLLKPGEVRVQSPDGVEHPFYVGGGALEVQPHRVTVLADTALRAKDIDEAAALAAKQRAEETLRTKVDKIGQAEALAELARAVARLKVVQRLRKLHG